MFFTKDKWKKEWEALEKKEQSFLKKNSQEKESSSGNSDCRSRRRTGRQCISEENNRLCGFEISSPLFKKEAVR
ncbi:MAG: hypothetical protein ACI4EY_03330 [Lachnospiraceae bacterium]